MPRGRFLLLLAAGFLTAAVPPAARAAAPPSPEVAAALDDLRRAGGPVRSEIAPATGLVRFLAFPRVGLPSGASAAVPAEERARAFMNRFERAFGVRADALAVVRQQGPDEVGMEHVRFVQREGGIPVRGGELIVHLRGAAVQSVGARTLRLAAGLATRPQVGRAQARRAALDLVRKWRGVSGTAAAAPALEFLDVGFFEGRAPGGARLVWFVEVRGDGVREWVWVDAATGGVLHHLNQLTPARNRRVYDAQNGSSLPGVLARSEGQAAVGDAEVNAAYDYSGNTYDYFWTEHARDSFDNAGASLISTVHYCEGGCPYANAFWDGTQMTYGEGFVTDDVAGHEISHAVTERTANLVYCLQSGALNESFSDIFGETIDLTNTGGTDTPATRWLMGEDIPGIGAIRNMMSPGDFGNPGRTGDPNFLCATTCFDTDNGGVHINSGVPNHAYALMVDGGTFNGITVTGIGLGKAGRVEYRALAHYLTQDSDFLDDYSALNQACTDLVGTAGITTADCAQVDAALRAVEMQIPPCGFSACGDAVVQGGEECDDGNQANGDGCDNNCTATRCGNGVVTAGEQCDDGGSTPGDGCEPDCTLTPGCVFVEASDGPQPIPDLGTATSTVTLPPGTRRTAPRVVGLRGTHTYMGDLRFTLTNPAGTTVVLFDHICGAARDFDLGLADDAPTPIPCPLTDGESHQPAQPLAALATDAMSGAWVLTIADTFSFDQGTLEGWGILACGACGDGQIDPGEECDDGNQTPGDGCELNCTHTPLAGVCTTHVATDLPQSMTFGVAASSTISVDATGPLTDVDVSVAGTHSWLDDLVFDLYSPDGRVVRLIDRVCDNLDEFDLTLDDQAPTGIPCPPTDGAAHLPIESLSAFQSGSSAGTWTLVVSDLANFDDGTLDQFSLRICTASTTCGNGVLDPEEGCDPGMPDSACCLPSCQIAQAGTTCRGVAGACDAAEVCDGVATACPLDVVLPADTLCRPGSGDPCDPEERCAGDSGQCPGDVRTPGGAVCRPGTAACDLAEFCPGTPAGPCPADAAAPAGTVCRAATGPCDAIETCPGPPLIDCPADGLVAEGVVCRAGSDDVCDPKETCSGASPDCPLDVVAPAGMQCRAGSGDPHGSGLECDPEERCTGSTGEPCPGDEILAAGTVCRSGSGDPTGSGVVCDPDETCPGPAGKSCPEDTILPATTLCRASSDECDTDEECAGVPGEFCAADGFFPDELSCFGDPPLDDPPHRLPPLTPLACPPGACVCAAGACVAPEGAMASNILLGASARSPRRTGRAKLTFDVFSSPGETLETFLARLLAGGLVIGVRDAHDFDVTLPLNNCAARSPGTWRCDSTGPNGERVRTTVRSRAAGATPAFVRVQLTAQGLVSSTTGLSTPTGPVAATIFAPSEFYRLDRTDATDGPCFWSSGRMLFCAF